MAQHHVYIVPHTHWDREWYDPFQTFRMRLVKLVDELMPLLETDPSYSHFLLDGQMAVVDDYLEVRPEAEERLRDLATQGRLSMGPWYILMDEFLVSGETIVRDLQLGMQRGAAFGGVAQMGYLPDMFGHIAQMPQILRQAGFEHAVVWRGVPSSIDRTGFWWEAPDGSTVRAEYLVSGYGNGAAIANDAKQLVRRVEDHIAEVADFLVDGLLFMNGTDHQQPQPWLGHVVAEANAAQDNLVLEVASLPEYLAIAPTDGLPRWRGELRSGARANVLMGVASNRVDVKRAAALTERELEQRAEPAAALFMAEDDWPQSLFELAWLGVIRNAAHDSICACSVDEVVEAVLCRFAESRQIATGITSQALGALARSIAPTGQVVVNLSPRPRSGVVELTIAGESTPPGAQLLSDANGVLGIPRGLGAITLDAQAVRTIIGMLPSGSQIDQGTWITGVTVDEDATGIDVRISLGSEEHPEIPIESMKQSLSAMLGARPAAMVRVTLDQPPTQRILATVGPVAGFGWQAFSITEPSNPVTVDEGDAGSPAGQIPDGSVSLSNGLVDVVVDATDGTFSVDGTAGFGRLVDGGDYGDSYNYSPPVHDSIVQDPESVTLSVVERGPIRGIVDIHATYRWPDHIDGSSGTRVGAHDVPVTTSLELRAGEHFLRVTTRFVNPCADHRLRVHLPLPEPAATSEAECAFAVVTRGLEAEGRPEERGLPTFPSRRFVTAGRLTVAHEGLLEYELVDIQERHDDHVGSAGSAEQAEPAGQVGQVGQVGPVGPAGPAGPASTLAITLLRSTGMLSRLGMAYRPMPAGPLTPVEGLQLLGYHVEARYALAVDCNDPYALVDDVFLPLEMVYAPGGGWREPNGSALEVGGAQVSSLRYHAGAMELRVFNPTGNIANVTIGQRSGWLVDLRGRPVAPVAGSFELRPFAIATVRLTS